MVRACCCLYLLPVSNCVVVLPVLLLACCCRCASRLAQRLQDRGLQQPAVLVMSGGWQRFSRLYGDNPELVQHE